ncbi:dispersed gene family protein 1 (DGF-1), putative, partial [Trypanosoma cruzi marinkellei]
MLELSRFDAPQQTLNITLLQCVFMGLSIKGSGACVHVNVTSSLLGSGVLEFEGSFGASSQILVAGSTLVTMSVHAIAFPEFSLGANSTLLVLDNRIEGSRYALRFSIGVVVDGGAIIVKGNTLRVTENNGAESAICVYAVVVKNGGYFDVENNAMSSVIGVWFVKRATVSSAGLLRVAECTFFGRTEFLILRWCIYRTLSLFRVEHSGVWR